MLITMVAFTIPSSLENLKFILNFLKRRNPLWWEKCLLMRTEELPTTLFNNFAFRNSEDKSFAIQKKNIT